MSSTYFASEEWARIYGGDLCPFSTAVDLAGVEPAKITLEEVAQVLSSRGRRLDNSPPPHDPISVRLAAEAIISLPAGEISLRSQKWQKADALLGVAEEPIFEYRRSVLRQAFPEWEDLPCSTTLIGWVVRGVYEKAILMGPASSYSMEISMEKMLEWARRGALVIQPPWTPSQYTNPEFFCWIFPNHLPEVWVWWNAIGYYASQYRYSAGLEPRQFIRLAPLADVVFGEIIGPTSEWGSAMP